MEPTFPTLPGYTVVALAGQGGMGSVYKAEQAMPHRTVAIKVLSGVNISADDLAAFHREAEVIAHLEHPRIVPLYSFGQQAGTPYLVLRYLGGGSVADRLLTGRLDLATAARWLGGVADALDFAHQKNIIHRDIKPSNILLDGAGNAYLTDFGIAGTLAAASASSSLGSAAYMSPEQARGEAVDGRADIYALAVTFFEMLTGQKPYTAETALGLIVRHINDPIPSARALNPAIPPAVDELIQWAMAKDPAARPQSAAEFGRLLQQALASPNTPLRAEAASLPTVLGLSPSAVPAQRRAAPPLIWWIGGIAVIGLCLLGGLLAGGGVLATVLSAPTATAPATPTGLPATPSPPVRTTPTPEGQLLAEDFSNPPPEFGKGDCRADLITYGDHSLCIAVHQTGSELFWRSKRVAEQQVTVAVDALQSPGPAGSEMAVICRWQDQNNYTAFLINGQGKSSIQQMAQGKLKTLQDGTVPVELGKLHRLQVTCSHSLSFASDGKWLVPAIPDPDPHPIAGDVALMAGLPGAAGNVSVTFSNLKVDISP